jgi:hypothetical protein
VDAALGIDGEKIESEPGLGQLPQRFRNRRMFDGTCEQRSGRIAAQAE